MSRSKINEQSLEKIENRLDIIVTEIREILIESKGVLAEQGNSRDRIEKLEIELEKLRGIKEEIKIEINRTLEKNYVTKDKFEAVQLIAYGSVAIICGAVLIALIGLL